MLKLSLIVMYMLSLATLSFASSLVASPAAPALPINVAVYALQ